MKCQDSSSRMALQTEYTSDRFLLLRESSIGRWTEQLFS